MNIRALFLARLKATLRSPGAMSIFLLTLLIPILLGVYSVRVSEARFRVAVVNSDRGEKGARLVEMLRENDAIVSEELSPEAATRQMRQGLLQCLFVIRPEFSEKLEALAFSDLIDLTVAPGCAYGASVSEPLINAVMKLWFEQQTQSDLDRLLARGGIALTAEQAAGVQAAMEDAWNDGAQIRVTHITQDNPTEHAPAISSTFLRTALSWFAALSLLFLTLSGQWISRFALPSLQQRLRQNGMGFGKSFLAQAGAQLAMVYLGFLLLLLPGAADGSLRLLFPALIYGVGALGLALCICTLCSELTSLLLMGPVLGVVIAFLSGLLIRLPDWGRLWVLASAVLPGRQFLAAMEGDAAPLAALAVSVSWLGLGVLSARLSANRRQRQDSRTGEEN